MGITAVNQNQINQFVDETGITYPILQDEQSGGAGPGGFGGVTYDDYYIPNQGSPYPRDFIVDQNGILVYANNEVDTEYMIYIIEDLLAGESLQTDEIKIVPAYLTVYPAYPNPFNPLTRIQYDLPEQTHVSLVIYDFLGREIRTLVSKIQRPGRHMIHWDGSNSAGMLVASGMYIYKLQSQNFITTKKIIYLK